MDNFKVKCNCGSEDIETTMENDGGYSNYTVMDDGYIEFKCKACGNFGSTDKEEKGGNNKLDQFTVTCISCGSTDWSYTPGDVDGDESNVITCDKCNKEEKQG